MLWDQACNGEKSEVSAAMRSPAGPPIEYAPQVGAVEWLLSQHSQRFCPFRRGKMGKGELQMPTFWQTRCNMMQQNGRSGLQWASIISISIFAQVGIWDRWRTTTMNIHEPLSTTDYQPWLAIIVTIAAPTTTSHKAVSNHYQRALISTSALHCLGQQARLGLHNLTPLPWRFCFCHLLLALINHHQPSLIILNTISHC